MIRLDGKAIVVTGAGRGIGAATVLHLAELGARVIVNDIDAETAAETSAAIRAKGGEAIAHAADITDWDAAAALIDGCVSGFGRIDGLVNNAGLFSLGRIDEVRRGELERLLSVNVVGSLHCAVHATRHMQAQRSGTIVNVTSGAQMGIPTMGLYGATKGAIATLTYAWALELADYGIRVNAVSPMANTRMVTATVAYHRDHGIENGPTAQSSAESNAPAVAYLLSDRSQGVNGQILRIDGENLSMVSHPAVVLPALARPGGWTAETIAQAFDSDLSGQLSPLGFTGIDIAGYGMPTSIWDAAAAD